MITIFHKIQRVFIIIFGFYTPEIQEHDSCGTQCMTYVCMSDDMMRNKI